MAGADVDCAADTDERGAGGVPCLWIRAAGPHAAKNSAASRDAQARRRIAMPPVHMDAREAVAVPGGDGPQTPRRACHRPQARARRCRTCGSMNTPPGDAVRVPAEHLRAFTAAVLEASGMDADHAALLAGLLAGNDLRGVFSHGTRQVATYARDMRAGRLNPRPEVRLVDEAPATFAVDGDGGLGYFPAHRAAQELLERARAMGVAVAVTRNHGHIGAAGIYSRVLASAGLIGYVTSGHQLHLSPGERFTHAAGGSPHSFAVPTGKEPPFVLDFGAMHDLYDGDPNGPEVFRLAPGVVYRSIGLGAVCQSVGGFLAGVPADPERARRVFPGANQGAFLLAVDIERFQPIERFRAEMDEYIRRVHALAPMPGSGAAMLPGEPEWRRERAWAGEGVPVGPDHLKVLRAIGEEVGVAPPA